MRELAMFPLGSPLLPGMVLPLRLFEDRYLQMYADIIDDEREFGVVLIERGMESREDNAVFDVGCLARIVGSGINEDGTIGLVSVGVNRIEIEEWLPPDPYPKAVVADLTDEPLSPEGLDRLNAANLRMDELLEVAATLNPEVETEVPDLSDDPLRQIYQLAQLAGLQAIDLQKLLDASSSDVRATMAEELIADTIDLIRLQSQMD